jgi:signal transduction histidine kinase
MQVFLNLIKNSERAMLNEERRELTIAVKAEKHRVLIRFRDTGSGVSNPERLFRPFQHGAEATGLGLYLSRALMRSFRGDLRFEPEPRGANFVVEVSPARTRAEEETYGPGDPDITDRRSQPFSGEPQPIAGRRA